MILLFLIVLLKFDLMLMQIYQLYLMNDDLRKVLQIILLF